MQVDFSGMYLPGAEFQEHISSSSIPSSSNKLLKITPHLCEITLQLLYKTVFNSLEIRGSYIQLWALLAREPPKCFSEYTEQLNAALCILMQPCWCSGQQNQT